MWTLHKLGNKTSTSEDAGEPSSKKRKEQSPEPVKPIQGTRPARTEHDSTTGDTYPWGFSDEELERFPALRKRNFWCVQRHQATALHYDLRMQLDGATVSWAVPKGLLGISKSGEANRLAVETTLHPISYTTHEGSDGRILHGGARCGTLLWDIGTYRIDPIKIEEDSDSESERRRKRRRYHGGGTESDDPLGRFQEDQFRALLHRPLGFGKTRSIHFTLLGGRKLTSHSYILILPSSSSLSRSYAPDGREKKQWFIRLPRGVEEHSWGPGGEEGEQYGRSVKTGRTFKEVCSARPARMVLWQTELSMFAGWGDTADKSASTAGKAESTSNSEGVEGGQAMIKAPKAYGL